MARPNTTIITGKPPKPTNPQNLDGLSAVELRQMQHMETMESIARLQLQAITAMATDVGRYIELVIDAEKG